ncbi:hypothetical protein Q5H92_15825 [Hymenobacter sp. M29]|uniref:Uncharacterized protein n=1 Tax=Hymenobacter mellowenesis TaxID=3063995 RepID=A0ABT9AFB6_9BACT|nr:hypothetical protein [Hymenobacter sp. M29]MDO7847835.1 hypothetical protein [Hymenobacter sp. M29]
MRLRNSRAHLSSAARHQLWHLTSPLQRSLRLLAGLPPLAAWAQSALPARALPLAGVGGAAPTGPAAPASGFFGGPAAADTPRLSGAGGGGVGTR